MFFRDPTLMRALRERAVPYLRTFPSSKIWIPACGTGQEAYAAAIVLRESGILPRTMIYATDEHPDAIATAQEGSYTLDDISKSSMAYKAAGGTSSLDEYYTVEGPKARIRPLHQHLTFAVHNMATDWSFNEFQMILCPNRLSLSSRVLSLMHQSLCRFGLLGISVGEHELVMPHGSYEPFAQTLSKKMS